MMVRHCQYLNVVHQPHAGYAPVEFRQPFDVFLSLHLVLVPDDGFEGGVLVAADGTRRSTRGGALVYGHQMLVGPVLLKHGIQGGIVGDIGEPCRELALGRVVAAYLTECLFEAP